VLSALLAGARSTGDVSASLGTDASVILRAMELREPSFAKRQIDRWNGEEWLPTRAGIEANQRLRRP